jgi:Domain of unknown function (DUF4340)
MNPRATWFLLLTALALGAYLYVTGPRRDAGTPALPGSYAPLVPAEITSVELLRSNAVLRVERSTNGWKLVLPVQYVAQGTAVDSFLESLAGLRPRTFIPPNQLEAAGSTNGLQAFGLGDNALTLKLESTTGPAVLFKLGGPAPLGGQFYFQRVGADGIFTADDAFLGMLPRNADAWRDRGLFDLTGVPYDRVEVRGKPGFVVEKEPLTGVWRLTRPLAARADGDRIEALLGALQRVRVAGFVTDSPVLDLAPLGLEPAEAELIVGKGTNDLVRLQFGRSPTNAPEFSFVRRMANTNLVLVPSEVAAVVRLPLVNFRDRQLTPDVSAADLIEFQSGTNRSVLERRGTNWQATAPAPFPVEADRVAQLLGQLSGFQIVDFPNDVPVDLARYGLDQPRREWGVKSGTNDLVRLSFGVQDGLDKVFVRRAGELPVYSMPLADLRRLPHSATQLRQIRFDATNVVGVTILQKGRTNRVSRGANGLWLVEGGAPDPLFNESVNETLYGIGHLDGTRHPLRDAKQFELLKFPEVDHTLVLQMAPGAPLAGFTIEFGGRNALDNLYALIRCDGDDRGFLVEFPGALYVNVLSALSIP